MVRLSRPVLQLDLKNLTSDNMEELVYKVLMNNKEPLR